MKSVDEGTVGHKIILEELRLLARVTSALSKMTSGIAGAPDFDAELINLRDQVAEAKPEDIPALVEQMMRISLIARRYGRGRDLPVDPESPYFAHLHLEEGQRRRDVLIGKRGYIDRELNVQIVDWRNAPVSRVYYRYAEGDDYEESFGENTLEGWIRARRSLTIQQGELRRIGCPQGTFIYSPPGGWQEAEDVSPSLLAGGQGKAMRPVDPYRRGGRRSSLGVHSGARPRADRHLPEIAALIDPQQFDLITHPESGLVVLQGGAGSGKTTVALHRVAYLAFRMPGRFQGGRMMVVVLTPALARYVERVLPSLGVHQVPVLTAGGWLSRTRRKVIRGVPDCYCQETPSVVLRLKKHPMMIHVARDLVRRQVEQQDALLRSELAGDPGARGILERWQQLRGLAPVPRCQDLRGWVRARELGALLQQRTMAVTRRMLDRFFDVVSDWEELLTDSDLLAREVALHCPGEFSEADLRRVARWCSEQFEGMRGGQRETWEDDPCAARGQQRGQEEGDPPGEDPPQPSPYISLDGKDERLADRGGGLDTPDDALLLYLSLLKKGAVQPPGKKPIRYEHLVVDEAQDLSALEIKVLLACTTKIQSVTLAGDTAQRTVFDNGFSDWPTLLRQVGVTSSTTRTLSLGYRSTQQIMALARQLIGDDAGVVVQELHATRSGAPVDFLRFEEQGELVALLAEALRSLALREPQASVALLTRHLEQAAAYARALREAEVPGVRLVASQDFSFRAGIEATDVAQPKGLEFDYVILMDASAANYPDTLESRHLLHIAATRAAHQLWITSVGPPSEVLPPL